MKSECERKGEPSHKYSHIYDEAVRESENIIKLFLELDLVHKEYKIFKAKYTEEVEARKEELEDQIETCRIRSEEFKRQSMEVQHKLEQAKQRFIAMSKQINANKERSKNLEAETYRLNEQKNYVIKETQDLRKTIENNSLIRSNLTEEVDILKKEVSEMAERKKLLEDFITKNLK